MAATDEMLDISLRYKPFAACIVPEKREERTTEGGLDAAGGYNHLSRFVSEMGEAGIRVSLFVEPDLIQVSAAAELGAQVIELHVGAYCDAKDAATRDHHYQRLVEAAAKADELGLECHAGHGISFETVGPIAAIPTLLELNIGHFLVGEAIYIGLADAIQDMRNRMDLARAGNAATTGSGQ
jgi:pyridoxine 5-phosphate synthase